MFAPKAFEYLSRAAPSFTDKRGRICKVFHNLCQPSDRDIESAQVAQGFKGGLTTPEKLMRAIHSLIIV
jgi:hypothetical protein